MRLISESEMPAFFAWSRHLATTRPTSAATSFTCDSLSSKSFTTAEGKEALTGGIAFVAKKFRRCVPGIERRCRDDAPPEKRDAI